MLTASLNQGQKRKGRWGYSSLFSSRGNSKFLVLENPLEDRASLQPAATAEGLHLKIGAAARFRRSGSRVLSVLGLRSNRGILINDCSGVYAADS